MSPLTLRFTELAVALMGAKDRLRVAVAEELGRAAGSAIRDVLTPGTHRVLSSGPSYRHHDRWDDDRRWDERDPWGEDRYEPRGSRYEDDELDAEPTGTRPAGLPQPLAIGLGLWRWWLSRGSWRGAVTVGLVASITALVGGPVVRAVLTTLAVAAELLAPAPLALEANDSR